jgi:hypothetical protein
MRRSFQLRRRNKGELQYNHLVMATIAIVSLLILGLFTYQLVRKNMAKMEIQDCKNSIASHAMLSKTTISGIFTDIKCPTRNIVIDLSKKEDPQKIMAEDMRRCWYEWLKGDGQFFQGEGVFCHVCSVYEFKQKNQQIENYFTYLIRENIKLDAQLYPQDRQKITYMQYFQGFSTASTSKVEQPPPDQSLDSSVDMTLDSSKKYTALFIYASGKDNIDVVLEGGGRPTAVVTGGLLAFGGGVASGIGSTFIVSNPIGWMVGGGIALGAGGYLIYTALNPGDIEWISLIQFMEYTPENIDRFKCQYLDVSQDSKQQ